VASSTFSPASKGRPRCLVTGCAGFIGSHLVDGLLARGSEVVGYDNFSTGQSQFLEQAQRSTGFVLERGDLLDAEHLTRVMAGTEYVFHLAANADIRFGLEHPRRDLEQNTLATFNVLEAMRANGISRLAFASSGSVYGEPRVHPTAEDCPFPVQTSLYGASKLAGEALISAYCEGFGFQANIFRFVSILGERYSHGHVFDFYRKLRSDPEAIEVLGNGRQRKSYLYVTDCVDAMLLALEKSTDGVNIFNLGNDDYCTVDDSLGWITDHLHLHPRRHYTGGERGWIGDTPFVFLDTRKIRALGWKPQVSIRDGILRTLNYLEKSDWLLHRR
jgi:UDP-glucose 4-epimerase